MCVCVCVCVCVCLCVSEKQRQREREREREREVERGVQDRNVHHNSCHASFPPSINLYAKKNKIQETILNEAK